MKDNVYQKLLAAQKEIVAPRDIAGRFGKARSAEKILEAVKPICQKHGLLLYTSDVMNEIGGRNYVTTTATVVNVDILGEQIEATASAWENDVSVGLDTSQVSGKTSSYAKKYALQNLFAIDDTKDADQEHSEPVKTQNPVAQKATVKQIEMLFSLAKEKGETKEEVHKWLSDEAKKDVLTLSSAEASKLIGDLM
jgi:hypothetical protein